MSKYNEQGILSILFDGIEHGWTIESILSKCKSAGYATDTVSSVAFKQHVNKPTKKHYKSLDDMLSNKYGINIPEKIQGIVTYYKQVNIKHGRFLGLSMVDVVNVRRELIDLEPKKLAGADDIARGVYDMTDFFGDIV